MDFQYSDFRNALALLEGRSAWRDLESAIRRMEEAVELEPSDPRNRLFLGQAYVLASRHEEGIEEIRRALDQSGRNILVLSGMGWACGMTGRRPEALQIVEELKRRFTEEYPRPYSVAKVYAGLGEYEPTFEWMEKAFLERDTSLAFSKTDETLADLRDDPRFADLMRRMRLAS